MLLTSVRKFGCPCARDNQKSRRTTKNTDVVVRWTTINFYAPIVKLDPIDQRSKIRLSVRLGQPKKVAGQPKILMWLSDGQL